MSDIISLSSEIEKQLPAELVSFIQAAGAFAASQGRSLYLVGGVVRDLLLERPNLDLDLVVEGDAVNLAQQLAVLTQGKIITHPRFKTAKLRWNKWSADLATARSETYERAGALPSVKPGSLANDLFRRDFTINAMAVELIPDHYGQVIDLYGGRDDLEHKLIRILHENSFIDDATRIWRSVRYEQRLDFQLEPNTLRLLERDLPILDTITGDRIRHELELVLKEELSEKGLHRAEELGVLSRLQPSLRGDDWVVEKFRQARQLSHPASPSIGLYLSLLFYRLNAEENEHLISYLRLPKPIAQTLRDTGRLKDEIKALANPRLTLSKIYRLLRGYSLTAIIANSLTCDSTVACQRIQTFLTKLRYIKPVLTGDDLKKMGIAPGPRMKEILQRLHEARLDGRVRNKKGEINLVKEWLG